MTTNLYAERQIFCSPCTRFLALKRQLRKTLHYTASRHTLLDEALSIDYKMGQQA
uniref:Putative tocopherol O-methyltransferaseic isoform X2 n=1 Tax=Rhizophora mucronata TaxID=61149 RepID=A0A2P2J8H6_RHIMU